VRASVDVALVRTLSASRAVRFCSRCYPMGPDRLKRRVAPARPLHGLRQQGRDAPASDLGRQQHRLHAVSCWRVGRCSVAPAVWANL